VKQLINTAFDQLCCQDILFLKRLKMNAIVDFASCLPSILSKACTTANIQLGFIDNGMIDRDSKSQADLKGILKTLRRTTSLAEEDMLVE